MLFLAPQPLGHETLTGCAQDLLPQVELFIVGIAEELVLGNIHTHLGKEIRRTIQAGNGEPRIGLENELRVGVGVLNDQRIVADKAGGIGWRKRGFARGKARATLSLVRPVVDVLDRHPAGNGQCSASLDGRPYSGIAGVVNGLIDIVVAFQVLVADNDAPDGPCCCRDVAETNLARIITGNSKIGSLPIRDAIGRRRRKGLEVTFPGPGIPFEFGQRRDRVDCLGFIDECRQRVAARIRRTADCHVLRGRDDACLVERAVQYVNFDVAAGQQLAAVVGWRFLDCLGRLGRDSGARLVDMFVEIAFVE